MPTSHTTVKPELRSCIALDAAWIAQHFTALVNDLKLPAATVEILRAYMPEQVRAALQGAGG